MNLQLKIKLYGEKYGKRYCIAVLLAVLNAVLLPYRNRLKYQSWNSGVEKYLSAVSGRTVTTVFPLPIFIASLIAQATFVPEEIPHIMPSSRASLLGDTEHLTHCFLGYSILSPDEFELVAYSPDQFFALHVIRAFL